MLRLGAVALSPAVVVLTAPWWLVKDKLSIKQGLR